MKSAIALVLVLICVTLSGSPIQTGNSEVKLSLPSHTGQLVWRAEGFKIVEASAKPNGQELGFRGVDGSGRVTFLGFLFLFPEQAPMTSLKCLDGIMEPAKKADRELRVVKTSHVTNSTGQQIEVVDYVTQSGQHSVRAFVATADICGDLAFYSRDPISAADANIDKIIRSYRFDPSYVSAFDDVFLYAQILYEHRLYKDAAPVFEQAIQKLNDNRDPAVKTMRRVATDHAGMAYGISGDIRKARAIFEAAIKIDPDYPLNYYNLACADAEEGKLSDARTHLKQAFDRKANMIPGEQLPDPTTDDSFLPHKSSKEFWTFLESLH